MNTQTESTQFQRGIAGDFNLDAKKLAEIYKITDVGYPVSGDRLAQINRG